MIIIDGDKLPHDLQMAKQDIKYHIQMMLMELNKLNYVNNNGDTRKPIFIDETEKDILVIVLNELKI